MLDDFLKLCGFEDADFKKDGKRVERAFEIAELNPVDIDKAEDRVRKYFDIELLGIRKLLGIWIKEFSDLVLAKEEGKKVVYPVYPPVTQIGLAAMMTSEDIYVCPPEVVIDVVLGSIIGKLDPLLEAAEVTGMGPGLAHCALLQARYGAIVKGVAPVPDLTLSTGFFCDQAPKIDELIHEVYDVPNVFIDRCYDPQWNEWPEIGLRSAGYFGKEIDRSMEVLKKVVGFELTDELKKAAFKQNAKGWFTYLTLLEYMKADPVPLTANDLITIAFIMCINPMRRFINEGPAAFSTLFKEVKQRVAQGKGVTAKGAPRVLMPITSFVDPSVIHMISRELGIAVPVCGITSLTPREMEKTKLKDFGGRIAESTLKKGFFHSTDAQIEYLKEVAQIWNVDGIILNYLFSCRPVAIFPLMAKRQIEKELGIPVLALEYDLYDSRDYSVQQVRTRVETFAELLKLNKMEEAA